MRAVQTLGENDSGNAVDPLVWFEDNGAAGFKLVGGDVARLEAALEVYQQNRAGVLFRSLELAYPATFELLGETLFAAMGRNYCSQVDIGRELDLVGAGLLNWLRLQPQGRALIADFPFLPGLISVEWARHLAYHSPNHSRISPLIADEWLGQSLSGGADWHPPPWQLHPALSLVTSRYPLDNIYGCLMAMARGEAAAELVIEPGPRRVWAIWPEPDTVAQVPVDRVMVSLLSWLKRPAGELNLKLIAQLPEVFRRGWLVTR